MIGIEKFGNSKIMIITDDKLLGDNTLQNVVISGVDKLFLELVRYCT